MRVTDGRPDPASSHAYTASLEAHRQVQAWDQSGRVELTEDVTVTLGGARSALDLRLAAQDLARDRGFGPGLGRGMGLGLGLGQGVGVRARGVPAMHMAAPPAAAAVAAGAPAVSPTDVGPTAVKPTAVSAPAVPEVEEPDPSEAEIARQAWMLVIRMTGDEQAAARLARRLAVFARTIDGADDVAAVLDRVVAQHNNAAASVTTADGREINVSAAFAMARSSITEITASVRNGAALDSDGGRWVDDGDAAFAQLSLWSGLEGSALTSLAQAGVGALATRNIATQYAHGASTGTLAASSIFLYEDGRAGFTGDLELYA